MILEFKDYRRKPLKIKAIRYDGTKEMAEAVEDYCKYSWVEYDEAGLFNGLYAFTTWGKFNSSSDYVGKGDYLIDRDGWLMLVREDDFEEFYEHET